jgi:hypothetical protein
VTDDPLSGENNVVVVAQFCPIPNATPDQAAACALHNDPAVVSDAERVFGENDVATRSRTVDGNFNREFAVVPIGGEDGDTDEPDLIAAETEGTPGGNANTMIFTWNDLISDPDNPTRCYAITSNRRRIRAFDLTVIAPSGGSGRARVIFPTTGAGSTNDNFLDITEFVVGAGDTGGCVDDIQQDDSSTDGAVVSGGNPNGTQPGYSTGGDAQALAIDPAGDTATARIDQKIELIDEELIHLLSPTGDDAGEPDIATIPAGPPGPKNLFMDFGSTGIPSASVGIWFEGPPFQDSSPCALETFNLDPATGGGMGHQCNVEQRFGPGGQLAP